MSALGKYAVFADYIDVGIDKIIVQQMPLWVSSTEENKAERLAGFKGSGLNMNGNGFKANGLQILTVGKGFLTQKSYIGGNEHTPDGAAVPEGTAADFYKGVWQCNGNQSVAVGKTAFTQSGNGLAIHGVGNNQFGTTRDIRRY